MSEAVRQRASTKPKLCRFGIVRVDSNSIIGCESVGWILGFFVGLLFVGGLLPGLLPTIETQRQLFSGAISRGVTANHGRPLVDESATSKKLHKPFYAELEDALWEEPECLRPSRHLKKNGEIGIHADRRF